MYNFRTDLALARTNMYRQANKLEQIDGIDTDEENVSDNIKVSRVKITNENGEKAIGKKKGIYVTIDLKKFKLADDDEIQKASDILSKELKNLVPLEKTINEARSIENLHLLIKNNGQNFEITEEQIKLAKKLI